MSAYRAFKSEPRRQRGLSLVEILVGVLIGMIGIIVIFQVLSVTEQRKRTTTYGSDAQTAGAIALYSLQRELQIAGLGFGAAHYRQLGCSVRVWDQLRPTESAANSLDFKFVPIEITNGAGGAPDSISVLWGNPTEYVTFGWQPSNPNLQELNSWKSEISPTPPDGSIILDSGRAGIGWGDILLLTSDPKNTGVTGGAGQLVQCALVQVSARPGDTGKRPDDLGSDPRVFFKDDWQSPPPQDTPWPPPALQTTTAKPRYNKSIGWPDNLTVASGYFVNLGKQPRRTVWSINNGRLEFIETLANAPGAIVAEGILNMQAEYGIDTDNDNIISDKEWTVTPPTEALAADANNPCNVNPAVSWRCVRAIRISLLTRSDNWDPTACSPTPRYTSGTSGGLVLTPFTMTNVDGSADSFASPCGPSSSASANDWRRYRYSVYETVIPLRNVIWGTAP